MLISHKQKLIFVHIQKTGGETISRLLRKNIPDITAFKMKHAFAIEGMRELKKWNEYFKFAFVRNPWDRLVSWYCMINNAATIQWYRALANKRKRAHFIKGRNNKLWRYVVKNSSTFGEFIINCTDEIEVSPGACCSFTYNQLDYLTDTKGHLIVDFIGRFESFERDLSYVFETLDIKVKNMPHENPSTHKHYSSYYTPQTEMIVRERFRRDIEHFNYKFEKVD